MKPNKRIALIVKPKELFFAWARYIGVKYPLGSLTTGEASSMYLVEKPEHDDYDSIIENHYEDIFELNLKKCVPDWESWPKNRT